ncbi:PKD domain-containing protein [Halorussus sp. MSC15.2]|uniref:PKD domain-containing protein n=1 Tax=Halorussus sp. MSC15.2 TaxID=2283638 RepID=UPI0013D3BF08|nr:PKD domain-containing protein [Halorussus sp. MSC15.2]NEU58035.1 PKD domain-containing protein [Halorussus sp. MSC15.2]
MNVDRTTILSFGLTVLLVTSALPPGIAGLVGTASADHGDAPVYTVRQPGTNVCYEVQPYSYDHPKMVPEVEVRRDITYEEADVKGSFRNPDWNGFESIESQMDYRYRNDTDPRPGPENVSYKGQISEYAPYLNTQFVHEGWEYATYGKYNWSADGESHLFFYENANGEVSLVVRHDRLYEETGTSSHYPYNGEYGPADGFLEPSPGGGTADWTFDDLPSGEWAYIDDMYPRAEIDDRYVDASGTQFGHRNLAEKNANYDRLSTFTGGYFDVHWTWGPGGTDGGAYRGFHNLQRGENVTIDAAFTGDIQRWAVRHNTGHDDMNGEMKNLQMDKPLVIERGARCLDANLNADRSPVEAGQSVTFTADEAAESYQWDYDGDGQVDENTTDHSVAHTYENASEKQATVTMVADGREVTASTTVEVKAGEPPTADFAVNDTAGDSQYHVVGESIAFDGSASSDNVALADGYEWRVNGSAKSGERVSHTFGAPGEYEVSLTVADRSGKTDNVTKTVTVVTQDDPTAEAAATPATVEAGAPITLDASASSDEHGSVESYSWSAPGGDVRDEDGGDPGASVTYGSAGDYQVELTATDNNGNADTDSVNVTVTNGSDPNITSHSVPSEVSVSETVEVSATATDNSDRSLNYTWTFSQSGTVAERYGPDASYQFDGTGAATVKLVVSDASGRAVSTGDISVDVVDRPNAELSVPDETRAGNEVTLDASNSTDQRSEITEYRWDFDGDGTAERTTDAANATVTHTYDSSGTYGPVVTVADDDGDTDNASATIEVKPEEKAAGGGGGGGGGGGSTSLGPPPVVTEVKQTGANTAVVDVRNGQSDETISAGLPTSEVAGQTGVTFRRVAVDIRSDDTHVAFESSASADPPENAAELTATDETLAYLGLDAKYLDTGVENATVEFTVNRSALGGLASGDDVAVYRYDAGWTRLDATVVESTGDAYRLRTTADGLGAFAVGANRPLAVADAELASETVATGDEVTATATVENTGTATRSAAVTLTLDGSSVASETVEVAPGESAEVTLTGTAPATGTYDVAVGGTSVGNLTVKETIPANTSVTDVSLNSSTISAGEQVEITATVENTGGEPGERPVTLTMFGEQLATKNVTVPPGETATVTFVRQVDAAGNFTVDVEGKTATLGVTSADDGGVLGNDAPSVPGFGVGTAVVALIGAVLLARRRD